jgi:uncharacterized protein (DUF433 family)
MAQEIREVFPGITVNPQVRFGKPVVRGTRVPVDMLVGKVASGMSVEAVANEYGVTPNDVRAALGYAAQRLAEETVYATE